MTTTASPAPALALRGPGILALSLLALLGFTQLYGTPSAVLFQGLVTGMVAALTAVGIVVVYRTTRIINFAQTAIGAGGAALCFELIQLTAVPFPLCFLAGLVLAGGLGLLFDLVFGRRFLRAPRLVLTVLTIVAAEFLGERAVDFVRRLPVLPPASGRTIAELTGTQPLRNRLPFSGFRFTVGSLPVPFGFAELLALGVSAVLLVAVLAALRWTRLGVAVRAMAENAERASLLGISVGLLSSVVWAATGVLSAASVTLTGLLTTPAAGLGFAPAVLLPALAAAILGRMQRIGVTVLASVGIAVLQTSLAFRFIDKVPLLNLGLFAVVALGLLLQRRSRERSEKAVSTSWQAAEEVRPIPRELLQVAGVRVARWVLVAAAAAAVVTYPFVTSVDLVNLGGVIALSAIVGLSLVILTGWAGQVSLGQYAFAAVGAVLAGGMSAHAGIPFWVGVPIASVATAGVATLVGLTALRIQGLFLAATTFAFAVAVPAVLLNPTFFGWLLPDAVQRPSFLLVDFADERSMYFLCLACLVLAVIVTVNLRRSRFGRTLIAVRDNENDAASNGLSPARAKLVAFALSGGMAGFAGAVLAFHQRGVEAATFGVGASFNVFVQVVLGGVGSIGGALLGSIYINATSYALNDYPILATLAGSGGTLYLLYVAPGGLISLVTRARDAVLRIVAQRHQIIVPSLFADIDPEALAARLAPLAPKDDGATSIRRRRYRLSDSLLSGGSLVYARRQVASIAARERTAIDAAARRVSVDGELEPQVAPA